MSDTKHQRYARLRTSDGRAVWAELDGERAHVLTAAPYLGGVATGEQLVGVDAEGRGPSVATLVPAEPTKILCVGRNYHAHAKELGNEVPKEPLLFSKPPSSLLHDGGTLELPPLSLSERVDHEAEVALVIGTRARRVPREEALSHVFGVTAACDVTARDLQKKDGQWTRAKGMDGFCPLGPVLVTGLLGEALRIRCFVDDEPRQDGLTSAMIFPYDELIAYVSRVITLEPGDVLLTGTPEGVGPLGGKERLRVELAGVGSLHVRLVAGDF
jgi:2-keto-4-pentenoate hydratase/2-oxohepta-3-ene-1,7-dioic acid hydratase in catechol pathway